MIAIRKSEERGHATHGWLDTRHSFSFNQYYDPRHVHFGPLRVLNEDVVAPGAGFPPHPHRDMEIITIVLDGAVAHQDSGGGEGITRAGDVQVMTAGTGVTHSEYNPSETERLRLLQIWIMPDARGRTPRYDQRSLDPDARRNRLLPVVSGKGGNGTLMIHQDATLYLSDLDPGYSVTHTVAPGRRAYLFVTRGALEVNGHRLGTSDALAIEGEPKLDVTATVPAALLLIDLPGVAVGATLLRELHCATPGKPDVERPHVAIAQQIERYEPAQDRDPGEKEVIWRTPRDQAPRVEERPPAGQHGHGVHREPRAVAQAAPQAYRDGDGECALDHAERDGHGAADRQPVEVAPDLHGRLGDHELLQAPEQ